jgi:hypothetical protein
MMQMLQAMDVTPKHKPRKSSCVVILVEASTMHLVHTALVLQNPIPPVFLLVLQWAMHDEAETLQSICQRYTYCPLTACTFSEM